MILTDEQEIARIWRALVQPVTLYDEWVFRRAFFDATTCELHALVDDAAAPTAMLPLERNRQTGIVRFIGTPFLERNRGFCMPGAEATLLELYTALESPYVLDDISALDPITTTSHVVPSDPTYTYDTNAQGSTGVDALLASLPRNIRKDIRYFANLESSGELSIASVPIEEAVAIQREISGERFKADAWFAQPHIVAAFHALPELSLTHTHELICHTYTHNGTPLGSSISLRYGNTDHMLAAATVRDAAYDGIGHYCRYARMCAGLTRGCTHFEAGIGDSGWKERWGFTKDLLYKIPEKSV